MMKPYESAGVTTVGVTEYPQRRRFGWRPAACAFLIHLCVVTAIWIFIAHFAGPEETMWASLLVTAVDLPVSLGTYLLIGQVGPDSPFAWIMGAYHGILGGIQWGLVAGWIFRRRRCRRGEGSDV